MDSIPDHRTVGRCMTVVTILAPDRIVVEIGQHRVMGIAACRMEGIIKVTGDHRMTGGTATRTAHRMVQGAALQGSIRATGQNHIGMTGFTVAVMETGAGEDIAGAVTGSTLGCTRGCQFPMGLMRMSSLKVSNICSMTILACLCYTDDMGCSSTMGNSAVLTVRTGTIAETSVRGRQGRINVAVLTVIVMDIHDNICAGMAGCRTRA